MIISSQLAVADPGFPVGGAWTPEAVTFQKMCMSKQKNPDPWGACAGHAPPSLDPPMIGKHPLWFIRMTDSIGFDYADFELSYVQLLPHTVA